MLCQPGQAALKAYDKVTKVAAERERYKSDRDAARQKAKASDQQARASGAKTDMLKKELVDARAAAEAA